MTFFSLLSPRAAEGSIFLHDDFDDGDAEGWEVIRGVWQVVEQEYGTRVEAPFTLAETQAGNYSWTDYEFEVDLYVVSGRDRNIFFRSNVERSIYTDGTHWWNWPTGYGIHITSIRINLIKLLPDGVTRLAFADFPFPPGNGHKFKVIVNQRRIKVFCDEILMIDYNDSSPNAFLAGRVALGASTGTVYPTEVWYDNVVVRGLEPEPTPSPTPFPTLEPLIFLPGLGGSWNHEEIFLGIDQPQNLWYETPFVNFYDGLIQTLQNAGYILGENLFIFSYDWLQPISQNATDLKDYINTVVNPPPGTNIDLLGHSLGGLVGRSYIQNNPTSHQVDQLITAGSPHKGASQIYYAWEGAALNQLLGPGERIAAGILLRLRGLGYPNLVQAIQNLIPSLSNLLFIEDYLRWEATGASNSESSMAQQNVWLKSLGVSPELSNLTSTLISASYNTPRWLRIVERNRIDRILGRWEDGKPVGEESAPGDGSVLEESAKLEGANVIVLEELDHSDLVRTTAGQEKLLEVLGFLDIEIVKQEEIPFEPALVFTIASPVSLRVKDPLGRLVGAGIDIPEIPNATFSAEEKIIVIPQAENGKYEVCVISENEGGPYKLLIGQLTNKQDIWTALEGEVSPGKSDTYNLPFNNDLQTTDIYLSRLINEKLKDFLRYIRHRDINIWIKARLYNKVAQILSQVTPLPMLIGLKIDGAALRYTQKAIVKADRAIDYAEEFSPDSLEPLREILDLLAQLYQLLES